jgi:hypothetical protein
MTGDPKVEDQGRPQTPQDLTAIIPRFSQDAKRFAAVPNKTEATSPKEAPTEVLLAVPSGEENMS